MRILFAIAVSIAAIGASAAQTWVDGQGQSCANACAAAGSSPVASGTFTNGQPYYVCAANEAGSGFRGGYNLVPHWADACYVGWGGKEVGSRPYACLCAGPASAGGGGAIAVVEATYGLNCGAPAGNATSHIAQQCNGRAACDYAVDVNILGDPVWGCGKDYRVTYQCGGAGKSAFADPEAGHGKVVSLRCP